MSYRMAKKNKCQICTMFGIIFREVWMIQGSLGCYGKIFIIQRPEQLMRANQCSILLELAKNTKMCSIFEILETNFSVTPCLRVLTTKLFCVCALPNKIFRSKYLLGWLGTSLLKLEIYFQQTIHPVPQLFRWCSDTNQ